MTNASDRYRVPSESNPSLSEGPVTAYVAARLPSLSETFVSNELLEVRGAGIRVVPVSVFRPNSAGMDQSAAELAGDATVVYEPATWLSTLREGLFRPGRTIRTLTAALRDAATSNDARPPSRARAPVQALAAIGLAHRLRRLGVAHLHAHMANTPTTIAMYAAMQLGVGFSFTGHANDLFVHRSFLPEKLRRAAFAACISRWHRSFYRRFADLPDDRLPVVRCGVETAPAIRPAGGHAPNRDSAEGRPHVRVLSVGRLVPKKGMDVLIRAIAAVGPSANVTCEIVGDGPERESLRSLIDALGVGDRVRLLGARPNAEVLGMIRACELFVLACRRDQASGDQDGIPVSLMEAMAAERCVVTSGLEPITELVEDGRTGLCVPPDDAHALAVAVRRLADDPTLRSDLARAGAEHVRREFDRRENAHRLAALFRRAAAAPAPDRALATAESDPANSAGAPVSIP